MSKAWEWKPWGDGKYWDLDKPKENRMARCYDSKTFEQLKEDYKSTASDFYAATNSVTRYSIGNVKVDLYEAMLERVYEGDAKEDRIKAVELLDRLLVA